MSVCGLWLNHPARKSNRSCTVLVPFWLKSALQQGVVLLPAALHAEPVAVKRVLAPLHADWASTAHVAPEQQAPPGGSGQGLGVQTVPTPWKVLPDPQLAWLEVEQAPVVLTQQAPTV